MWDIYFNVFFLFFAERRGGTLFSCSKLSSMPLLFCNVPFADFKSLAMHGSHCVPKFNRIRKSGITWACCFVLSAFITL
ncbi:hypothetical protein SAMN05216518_10610 [Bacteroidales bacterium KHT7]|nr:hypothetical protein SAMN05216518_10610 [Bacteroidales bacterium KHT7]